MIPNKYINIKKRLNKSFNILGLAGKRRSGKDYVGALLLNLDTRFTRISFADHLKLLYSEEYGVPIEELNNIKFKEKHRRGLQTFSIKMKQENGEFIFVNKLLSTVDEDKYYVITDVRFLCELQTITLMGGVTYKIHADNAVRSQRGWHFDPKVDNDDSEIELGDLSGDTFYQCCGGGTIYNNSDDSNILSQLNLIVKNHFPIHGYDTYEKLKKIHGLEL